MPLLLGLIALGLAFLLPGHYVPWVAFEQQALASVALLLMAIAAFISSRGRPGFAASGLACAALAASAIPPLQWLAGRINFVSDAVLPCLFLLAFFASIVSGRRLATDQPRNFIEGSSVAFLVTALVSVCLATLQWWGSTLGVLLVDMGPGSRPFANLGQPNHLATLIALGAMGVLLLFERRRLPGIAAWALMAVLGFGLVLTQSRTGWVFMALMVGWRAAASATRPPKVMLRTSIGSVVVGAVVFAALVANWDRINDVLLLSSPAPLAERLQGGTRWQHWTAMWEAAWQAPWFGYGWNQAGLAQQAVALGRPASHEWLTNSHDIVLDLIVWNGIPIGALLAATLAWWFVKRVRACRTADQWCLMIGVGAIVLHALLEYPLDYLYFVVPLGLLTGALESMEQGDGAACSMPKLPTALVFTATFVFGLWVTMDYLKVQTASRELRFAVQGFDGGRADPAPVPDVVLLDSLRELHRFWLTAPHSGMTPADVTTAGKLAGQFPSPSVLQRYAEIAGLNGRPGEAQRALALMCKLDTARACTGALSHFRQAQIAQPALSTVALP